MPEDYFAEFRMYNSDNSSTVLYPAGPGAEDTDFILFAGAYNLEHCVSIKILYKYAFALLTGLLVIGMRSI